MLVQLIFPARLNDSSFTSVGGMIKKFSAELDRIEDNAPSNIPYFIEKRFKSRVSTV